MISLVGSSGVFPRDCNFAKLQTQTECLADSGEPGGGDNVEEPPHDGVGKARVDGCGNDVGDEEGGCKVDAALCAADEGDKGERSGAAGGDEERGTGDPTGEVAERYVGVVEDLVGYGGDCAGGVVEDDQQNEVGGVETGLEQDDLGEDEDWIEAVAAVEGAVDGHGGGRTKVAEKRAQKSSGECQVECGCAASWGCGCERVEAVVVEVAVEWRWRWSGGGRWWRRR